MLGGEDRLTLYLVTAASSDAAKARAERNGALEQVRTSVPGAGRP
jgi:sugar lactone lactonase YvrE